MLQSTKSYNIGEAMAYNIYENILNQFSSEQAQALIFTFENSQRKILEAQTEEVIYKTRNSLSNEFATKSDLEKSILEAKLELKEDIANLKTELKAVEIDILKWVGAGFVATITITLAGVGLMIEFL